MNHPLYPLCGPVKGPNAFEQMETSCVKEEPRSRTLTSYPRCIGPSLEPFDPVELAYETEKIVCRGDARKYTDFYVVGVYGGIATGYAVGCCLRCVFCWVDWSRDYPQRFGQFYSPDEAFRRLKAAARRGVNRLRVSGAEPTIGKSHLLALLERFEASDFELFILETNGILFGVDKDYVRAISRLKKIHVRVSLKAGTPEAFARKTGAEPESFDIPFRGVRNLLDCGVSFHVAAMSADPRIMTPEERRSLIERLEDVDLGLALNLEEEIVDRYRTTLARLRYAALDLDWPLREAYAPIRSSKPK
jgi:uncharacterized Fe-S cluster-containing radical SAM superfamily protein